MNVRVLDFFKFLVIIGSTWTDFLVDGVIEPRHNILVESLFLISSSGYFSSFFLYKRIPGFGARWITDGAERDYLYSVDRGSNV